MPEHPLYWRVASRAGFRCEYCRAPQIEFNIRATDGPEEIGIGTHERMIIDLAKFSERLKVEKRQMPNKNKEGKEENWSVTQSELVSEGTKYQTDTVDITPVTPDPQICIGTVTIGNVQASATGAPVPPSPLPA